MTHHARGSAPADQPDANAISLTRVWAAYAQSDALQDVSLQVPQGEFVALVGPNGGGKTTLIKLVVGLLAPVRGQISVLGQSVEQARPLVGYVPQDIHFDRDFPVTAREVARMGRLGRRRLLQPYTDRDDEITDEALRRVGVMHLRNRPIGALSGVERQRVYIARALASEPRLLLLDEPLASVDPEARGSIQELLASLAHRVTIVMSSHDVGTLLPHLDRIGYLNRRLVYYGPPGEAPTAIRQSYHCPAEAAADALGVPESQLPHEAQP